MTTRCTTRQTISSKRFCPTKTNKSKRSNKRLNLPRPRKGRRTLLVARSKEYDSQSKRESCESDELCYICDDGGGRLTVPSHNT